MNQDELLAKYLDGNLSTAEQAELQTLLDTSPALAEELRAMEGLEQALASSKSPLAAEDLSFLNEVGNRAVDAIPVAPPAASGLEALTAKFGAGLTGKIAGLGGAIVLAGSAGIVVWQMQSEDRSAAASSDTEQLIQDIDELPDLKERLQLEAENIENTDDLLQIPSDSSIDNAAETTVEGVNSQRDDSETGTNLNAGATDSDLNTSADIPTNDLPESNAQHSSAEPQTDDVMPNIDGSNTLDVDLDRDTAAFTNDLKRLTQEFRQAQNQGDNATLAQKALQLGKLLENRSVADSRKYYNLALKFAQNAGLPAVEQDAQAGLLRLQ